MINNFLGTDRNRAQNKDDSCSGDLICNAGAAQKFRRATINHMLGLWFKMLLSVVIVGWP